MKPDYSMWLKCNYPTVIVRDRYDGLYSGGEWLAFPRDRVPAEAQADDVRCVAFWKRYAGPVGKGRTPIEAFLDLDAAISWKVLNMEGEG